jgi:hypothetical protein
VEPAWNRWVWEASASPRGVRGAEAPCAKVGVYDGMAFVCVAHRVWCLTRAHFRA